MDEKCRKVLENEEKLPQKTENEHKTSKNEKNLMILCGFLRKIGDFGEVRRHYLEKRGDTRLTTRGGC
ncbi:MAG: hypothetical protein GX803_08860 [Lentisphaerae bacterium]|nr:hypothetical protein [Lentisphaerota bacterium]